MSYLRPHTDRFLVGLANQVETMVSGYDLDIKVAVMGCVVNGPGEAKEVRSRRSRRNRQRVLS